MKRGLCILLALGLLLSGCTATMTLDEAHLKTMTETVFKQLQQEEYGKVVKQMDEKLALQVSEETLKNGWQAMLPQLGDFVSVESVSAEAKENQWLCTLKAAYTHQGLTLTLVYNQQGRLDGISLTFGAAAQKMEETEQWQELPLEVGEWKLAGKLTLPKGVEKPPVIILVQGSGQHDMDETVGKAGNKPFADLAHGLAELGIATIRYDKRYYDYPEKATDEMTVETEVLDDVASAVQLAQSLDSVNHDQIFVAGHSLGGMLTPKIAADHPELKGVIAMAGTLRTLDVVMKDQIWAQIEEADMSEEKKEQARDQYAEEFQRLADITADTPNQTIMGAPSSYWYSLNQACGLNYLNQIEAMPMLILQGGRDIQVYPDVDYPLWQEHLKDRTHVEYHLYPELNHLFMTAITGKAEDYDQEAEMEPQVIRDIAAWVQLQINAGAQN